MADTANTTGTKSSPVMIALAWLLVGLPLGWGVYNTLLGAMKLFANPPAAAAPASPTK
jgi:hypothetical protein